MAHFRCMKTYHLPSKVWSETNRTMLEVGHFTTISGHFLANYINGFNKMEVLTVILKCSINKNLNWIKIYSMFSSNFLQFCKNNPENLWLINGHFTTISGHCFANYKKIVHKTEVQTIIFRCLVCLNSNWIKSNDILWVKIIHHNASFQG